ncbi:MAG: MFS transporter [Promethearchaeota archaeon]
MKNSNREKNHGNLEILSYGGGSFLQEFIGTVFGSWLFFFYEIEVGLDLWLLTLGYLIYATWNSVNSPLLGYLTDKKRLKSAFLGRRFPWLLISGVPWMLSLFFLYTPLLNETSTEKQSIMIFIWFLLFILSFSLFGTIFGINYSALYPDKFQEEEERRVASGIVGAISFLGGGLGSLLPALIIKYGDRNSYSKMALIAISIGILVYIFSLPGFWEEKSMRQRNLKYQEKNPKISFFHSMKIALKHKNFVIFIILFFFIQFSMVSVGAAFPYAVRYIFHKEAIYTAFLAMLYILGAVLSLPLWMLINKKLADNKKSLIIAGLMVMSSQIAIFFTLTISFAIFSVIFYGFSIAGFWTNIKLRIMGNVFDEIVAETGFRDESTNVGISGFFINFTTALQSSIFALVHKLTGFKSNAEVQTGLAQLGIRLTLSFIPLIFILVGMIIFLKWYDLTPRKIENVKLKLEHYEL